jgi:adenine-specific DNA-methyltransferase
MAIGRTLCFIRYLDDFPAKPYNNLWIDTRQSGFSDPKTYVVQTGEKIVERCLLMTTDPGDLIFDPTCGSGTTSYVAEKWGRRWITCDTSRVAVTLARQRLMTAGFDYFPLKYPQEGVKSGFIYKTVPHVTLKSIANNPEIDEIYERDHPKIEAALAALNTAIKQDLEEWEVPFDFPADWPAVAHEPFDAFHAARRAMQKRMDDSIARNADQETLYNQPRVDKKKTRVTGPFTVEAVPFPTVLSLDETEHSAEATTAVARSGESARHYRWNDELLANGIRGKNGRIYKFAELITLVGTRYLHAVGILDDSGERVAVSFGPEFAALEQRQVALALDEAGILRPTPKYIVFAAFSFDPEAAKDIDETNWPGVTLLKAQMNADLLTDDLKKKRSSNESFWLIGQPEISVIKASKDEWRAEVHGFDYFDMTQGEIRSGGKRNIAMWLLDTDYNGRSLLPAQVFFPMAGEKDGWSRLAKNLKAVLDESRIEAFHGTLSLPFKAGKYRRVAVKIVDDRGIESLVVKELS